MELTPRYCQNYLGQQVLIDKVEMAHRMSAAMHGIRYESIPRLNLMNQPTRLARIIASVVGSEAPKAVPYPPLNWD